MAAVSYQSVEETSPLATFRRALAGDNVLDRLREGLVGSTAEVVGPYGRKPLLYADYVASGRALRQVECGFRINGTAIPVNPGQSFH